MSDSGDRSCVLGMQPSCLVGSYRLLGLSQHRRCSRYVLHSVGVRYLLFYLRSRDRVGGQRDLGNPDDLVVGLRYFYHEEVSLPRVRPRGQFIDVLQLTASGKSCNSGIVRIGYNRFQAGICYVRLGTARYLLLVSTLNSILRTSPETSGSMLTFATITAGVSLWFLTS